MSRTILRTGQFYGETQVCRTIPGFKLIEATYAPGVKLPKHSHQCACFSLTLQGGMLERYGTRTLEVQPQTVAFNAADEPHSNAISRNGARFLILEIASELITRIDGRAPAFSKSSVFNGGELSWLGLRLYRESSQTDAVTPVALEGLGLEMLAALFRLNDSQRGKQTPRWVAQARELIHAQFAESLSVSGIASTVGVHPVHLARTFRKHYNCSIGDYVRRLRIERAQRDISSSRLSLVEIALQTGFCDQGHLTRVFKRLTGMTPAKYRARFRSH